MPTISGGVSTSTSTITNASLKSQVTTYGALILPYDIKAELQKNKPQNNPKVTTSLMGNLKSAFNTSTTKDTLKSAIKNPHQTFKTLSKYMTDNRDRITSTAKNLANDITTKYSGIAVAQTLINGKVTTREALDYLFMGFAPALGVQGSLMGYSGIQQMKEALFDGSIDVGSFINGITKTIKGATDLKDMLLNKKGRIDSRIIEFDLTQSHSESYQAETPDRRVQSGVSLNEYIHNMPVTFNVQCALQDNKRYSKPEFRAIIEQTIKDKLVVALVLGDEMFEDLVITGFSPNNDCTRSGMTYELSFKKITFSEIDTETEVTLTDKPPTRQEETSTSTSAGGGSSRSSGLGGSAKIQLPNMSNVDPLADAADMAVKSVTKVQNTNKASWLAALRRH